MGKANDEKKQVNMDESTAAREERDRDIRALMALMEEGDLRAAAIYRSIGVYLAHSLALYHDMYHFRHVLLLGRVMSGAGGELVIEECGRVLRDEYSAYLGEIIIEGYTDSTGDYYNNLKLSQERALSVATYILKMPGLTTRQRDLLKSGLLTITGRGATGLIYDQYGNEDKEASRRVEFHFSLKDSEMIDQMNRLSDVRNDKTRLNGDCAGRYGAGSLPELRPVH